MATDTQTGEITEQDPLEPLRHLSAGTFPDDFAEDLAELITAVQDTGKSGTLTLVLKVEQKGRYDQIEVTPDIKLKRPRHTLPSSLFYTTDGGDGASGMRLVREDPRQTELDLRTTEANIRPLRKASGE
ncbi:MAG: hypothetical protein AAGG50_13325 [Bacteroidota bacterium]